MRGASAAALLVLSLSPSPNFPCGTPLPGFGMAGSGASGELLIDLSSVAILRDSLWVGPGVPAPALIAIPNLPILAEVSIYVQGALFDPTPGANPSIGITDALHLVIGF